MKPGDTRPALRVASYRVRCTFARRRGSYLSLVVLVGLLGGLAMGSIAAARRTDSSFPVYLASTNPSTVMIFASLDNPALGFTHGYAPTIINKIARLPYVERSSPSIGFDGNIDLGSIRGAHPNYRAGETPPAFVGGLNGEYVVQDKVTLVAGHLADPRSLDQAVMNAQAAAELGLHVGSVIGVPFYTDAEATSPTYNGPPHLVAKIVLVGEVVFASSVVEDDIDALGSGVVLLSEALTARLAPQYAYYSGNALVVAGGARNAVRVLNEAVHVDPIAGFGIGGGADPAATVTKAQHAIKPEAIALGVFGGIAGLALVMIVGLTIARILGGVVAETGVLRSMGAGRSMLLIDLVFGLLGPLVVGGLLAVSVAVALSPLAPLGPVRPVFPSPGLAVDATVLGLGLLALLVVLAGLAALLARRAMLSVSSLRRLGSVTNEPAIVRSAAASRLPISVVTGLRFALGSSGGRSAGPVRSATVGAALALSVLVTTVTFGASLDNLVSHPALYGWNWNVALLSGFAGQEDLPAKQVARLLDHDRYVVGWSGVNFLAAKLDGQRVQVLTEQPGASVAPPLLSGHGLEARDQIVLGRTTLAALHKRVGETVLLTDARIEPERLRIVGTATLATVAKGFEMGTGAVVATSDFPTALLNVQQNPIPGPQAVLIRLRPGADLAAVKVSLRRVLAGINAVPGDTGSVGGIVSVLRPAEIVNYRSMGTTPAILGGGLAAGAVVALGLTLVASVRRRRRELALLKALGFTERQLGATVSWQASIAVSIGICFGVPVGVALGRFLWDLFATEINAVPSPTVPAWSIALIALAALVAANLVAALPGRLAARTPTALALRAE